MTVGSRSVVGVGVGGNAGGMGRTRVGNEGIAGFVKHIVKCIEAGFLHTREVGSDELVVGDLVGPEALTKLCCVMKRCIIVKIH